MRLAGAAQPARTRLAGAGRLGGVAGNAGREHGQFLLHPRRAAVRAFVPPPVGGPREDCAVPVAFVAMKFVDRHGTKVAGPGKISSRSIHGIYGVKNTGYSRMPPRAIDRKSTRLNSSHGYISYA